MSLQRNGTWQGGVWAPSVWADGVWLEQAAQALTQGPWRLLSGDYPKPRRRDVAKIFWPGDADYPPSPSAQAPRPVPNLQPGSADREPLAVLVSGDSPFREQLLGALEADAVSREVDPAAAELERAIALLLLGGQ